MAHNLPQLQILPTASLTPHEWHDDQRAKPLVERLRASGVLRNPPIVTPLADGTGRYMVLDGANRSTAFRQMGLPHILAQVVAPDDPGLDLHTWNHVLWGWDAAEFLKTLGGIEDTRMQQIDPTVRRPQSRWPIKTLVWVQTPDGKAHIVRSQPDDLAGRSRRLVEVARAYMGKATLDRTTAQQVSQLGDKYAELTAIVVYPPYTPGEVLELCAAGILLPPGITRFTISPRGLRVNYPLDELSADRPIETKNAALERWISERIARKGVRYYAEPTVLYDE
ncbi:MAG: hypothetical protein KIS80_07390 [Anaerolineales bacterium]|nr:hypothetical protein [Anaerolineales bacterium]